MFRIRHFVAAGGLVFGTGFADLGSGAVLAANTHTGSDLHADIQAGAASAKGNSEANVEVNEVADTEIDTAAEEVEGDNNQVEQVEVNDNHADAESSIDATDTPDTSSDNGATTNQP